MEAIAHLSWKLYPVSGLMAFGLLVSYWGVRTALTPRASGDAGKTKLLATIEGFRYAVVGIALLGVGASWQWNITWLFVLSLVFGGEELLESTVHLSILRHWPSSVSKAKQLDS